MDPTAIPLPASRRNSTLPNAEAAVESLANGANNDHQDIVLDSAAIDSFATLAQLAHSIALPETVPTSPEVALVKHLDIVEHTDDEDGKEADKHDEDNVNSPGVLDECGSILDQVVPVARAVDDTDHSQIEQVVDELTVAQVQEKLMEVVRRGSVELSNEPMGDATADQESFSAATAESPAREVVVVEAEPVTAVPDAADIAEVSSPAAAEPAETETDDALVAAARSIVDDIVDGIDSEAAAQDHHDDSVQPSETVLTVPAAEPIPDQSSTIDATVVASDNGSTTPVAMNPDQLATSMETLSLTTVPAAVDSGAPADRPLTPPMSAEADAVAAGFTVASTESDAESTVPLPVATSDSDRDQASTPAALTTDDELDTANLSQYMYSTAAETETEVEAENTDAELESLRRASIQSDLSSTSVDADADDSASDLARAHSPTPSSASTAKRLSIGSNTSAASRTSATSSTSSASAGKKPAAAAHSLKTPVKKPTAASVTVAEFKVPTKPSSRTATKAQVNKLASSSSSSSAFKAPTVPASRSVPPKTPTSKAASTVTRGTAASDARTKKPVTSTASASHLGPATPHPSTIADTTKVNQLRGTNGASPSKKPSTSASSSSSSLNARLKSAGTIAATKALTSGTRTTSSSATTVTKTPTRSTTRPVSGATYSVTTANRSASATTATTTRATKSAMPATSSSTSSSRPRTPSTLTTSAADVAKLHAEIAELKAMVVSLASRVKTLESQSVAGSAKGEDAMVVEEQPEGQTEVAAVSV